MLREVTRTLSRGTVTDESSMHPWLVAACAPSPPMHTISVERALSTDAWGEEGVRSRRTGFRQVGEQLEGVGLQVGVAAAEANHPDYGLGHLTHALLVGVYGSEKMMLLTERHLREDEEEDEEGQRQRTVVGEVDESPESVGLYVFVG